MTTNNLLPFGAMAAIIIGVLTALSVAGAVDNNGNDDLTRGGDGTESDVAALCVEGVPDCNDMIVKGEGVGGDDDEVAGEPPAVDGDGTVSTCLAGTDCTDDAPLDCGGDLPATCDEPVSSDGGTGSVDPLQGDDPSRGLAIDASFRALELMGGSTGETQVTGAKTVEWNDSCLGVEQPGVACAEVITPGWIVIISDAVGDYEFHTDNNGNAVFFPHD